MSVTLPVYVFGNVELFQEVFNAVVATLGDGGYGSLLKLVILIAGTCAIVQFSLSRNMMVFVKFLSIYYLSFYVLFYQTTTIDIIDRLNSGATEAVAVDKVPLGLALISSYTTRVGAGLTQLLEKNFSLPGDLNYSKTGLVMASKLALASADFEVAEPQFAENMSHYVSQCVYYDLLLGKYSWQELSQSEDVWNFVSTHASPARAFLYKGDSSEIVTCQEGVTLLNNDFSGALLDSKTKIGQFLFPNSTHANKLLMSYLPLGYQTLTGISQSGDKILTQSLMLNLLQNGILNAGAETGSPETVAAYAFVKARDTQRLSNNTAAQMAAHWLPLIQNIIEATLFGGFVIAFLMMVMVGWRAIKWYGLTLAWTQLWAPLYAILNLFMTIYAKSTTIGALGGQGLTLANVSGFAAVNADVMNLAGYLSVAVPFIALGFLKLDISAFNHLSQYVGGAIQGAATAAAGEAQSGNLSVGNIHYATNTGLNTSANHFDNNVRLMGGSVMSQLPGGSVVTSTENGQQVLNSQGALSHLGVNANLSDTFRSAYTRQAEHAESSAYTEAEQFTRASTAGFRSMINFAEHTAKSQGSGQAFNVSDNAAVNDAFNHVARVAEQIRHHHGLSVDETASVMGSVYSNASGGVDSRKTLVGRATEWVTGAHGSVNGGVRHDSQESGSQRLASAYDEARELMHDSAFNHHLEVATRALKEESYRESGDAGTRLTQDASHSFDKAESARSEMIANLQQAESYREGAQYATEHAMNINANASQVLMGELAKEGYSMAEIESLTVNHPEEAQIIAEQALAHYVNSVVEHGAPASHSKIDSFYHEHTEHLKTDRELEGQANAEMLNQKREHSELAKERVIDKQVKDSEFAKRNEIDAERQADIQDTTVKGQAIAQEVTRVQQKGIERSKVKGFLKDIDQSDNR